MRVQENKYLVWETRWNGFEGFQLCLVDLKKGYRSVLAYIEHDCSDGWYVECSVNIDLNIKANDGPIGDVVKVDDGLRIFAEPFWIMIDVQAAYSQALLQTPEVFVPKPTTKDHSTFEDEDRGGFCEQDP